MNTSTLGKNRRSGAGVGVGSGGSGPRRSRRGPPSDIATTTANNNTSSNSLLGNSSVSSSGRVRSGGRRTSGPGGGGGGVGGSGGGGMNTGNPNTNTNSSSTQQRQPRGRRRGGVYALGPGSANNNPTAAKPTPRDPNNDLTATLLKPESNVTKHGLIKLEDDVTFADPYEDAITRRLYGEPQPDGVGPTAHLDGTRRGAGPGDHRGGGRDKHSTAANVTERLAGHTSRASDGSTRKRRGIRRERSGVSMDSDAEAQNAVVNGMLDEIRSTLSAKYLDYEGFEEYRADPGQDGGDGGAGHHAMDGEGGTMYMPHTLITNPRDSDSDEGPSGKHRTWRYYHNKRAYPVSYPELPRKTQEAPKRLPWEEMFAKDLEAAKEQVRLAAGGVTFAKAALSKESKAGEKAKKNWENGDSDEDGDELADDYELNAEQEAEIIHSFKLIDMDGDGFINVQDITRVMEEIGENVDEWELREMLEHADTDQNSFIDLQEYRDAMRAYYQYEESVQAERDRRSSRMRGSHAPRSVGRPFDS